MVSSGTVGVKVTVVIPPGEQVVSVPIEVMVTVSGGEQVEGPPPLVTVIVCVWAGCDGQTVDSPLTGVVPVQALQDEESRAKSGLAFASKLKRISKVCLEIQ